ncbi:MAG: flagellar hook-length control protein FliK, partial [Gammaproteobacteria bacterium]|nr:flagellar hook-length control protein FliK [Gammaproteobacteria bacterium]
MPLSVQVAAPASQSAQMLAGSSSSTPSSSTGNGGSGERAFSNHLEAEKRSDSSRAGEAREKSADNRREATAKPATTGSAEQSSESEKGSEKAAVDVAEKGNTGRGSEREGQASPHRSAKLDAMDDNPGLQNAPAKGLSELTVEAPFTTMAERVLSLLAAETGVDGDASEPSVDSQVLVTGGNTSPLEDALLPQQTAASTTVEPGTETLLPIDVELLPAHSEVLSASAQQVAVQVDAASVAAALRQGDVSNSNDIGALSSVSLGSNETVDTLARPGPASVVSPELARVLSGKQALVSGEFVDAETDVDPGMELLSGKTTKPVLEGSVSNSTLKMPATQIVAEALSNGSGSKENFEQVRQNIMAAMAGKPELGGPAFALNTAADGGEAAPQGLNFSNISSALAVPGTESAKYSATQETAPPRFFTLQTPAGQPGWDVEVGNRIRWMVGQNNSGLELRLNPAELGSVEVKLSNEGERTNVTFFAANPAAREALEAALPRLREMFADSGMQLANADVSDQSLQQEREQLADSGVLSSDGNAGETMALETESGLIPGGRAESRGVIDYYI